ncbi:hypothetical protein BH20ACT21_BH20ACT21_05260 [soil metagenome]|nr:hypothetical protein [Actinomycetota bacterium]MDQ3218821.1 hypothetical protein [Actinomycetota bacterium]
MAETISPAVHGGRSLRYWRAVALHVLGAALTAAALGLVLGSVGAALGAPWLRAAPTVVAAVAILYFLREAVGLPMPVPSRRRQVPDWWRTFYSPAVSSLLYGLGLGAGFFTFLSFGTLAAVAVAALAGGSPLWGAALCAPFGAARGISVLASLRALDPEQGAVVVDRLQQAGATRLPSALNAGALLLLAAAGVVAGIPF